MSSTRESGTARSDLDVSIIRAEDRSTWRDSALLSRQSFPATGSFDLESNAFGLLMFHNDDVVAPGEGFDMHRHHDVELVTWVMEGHLRHRDDGGMEGSATGTESILSPSMAQRISAGRGIRHSELNASGYLDGTTLYDGDVARITADPNSSTSIESLAATVVVNAEVLVWTMDRGIG